LSSRLRMLLSIAAMVAIMKTPIAVPVATVSCVTGLLIAFVTFENRLFNRLGDLSYSLYLLHIAIGLRIIYFTSRFPCSASYLLLLDFFAIAVPLYVSALFFRWIEEPWQRWSSAIKIKPKPQSKPAEEMVAATVGAD